ncbi:hypothetical protein RvY_02338 [Ramazzottius varieornatus]|uniref:Uncharacterized protein n=1 Tax=Ramazzottius varieornatus TaxID=947166 RepID=A0A1D1UJF3_RAMVA|nr:hypothetical protein RvY_02338 [Ramazzottius varieornatus]
MINSRLPYKARAVAIGSSFLLRGQRCIRTIHLQSFSAELPTDAKGLPQPALQQSVGNEHHLQLGQSAATKSGIGSNATGCDAYGRVATGRMSAQGITITSV